MSRGRALFYFMGLVAIGVTSFEKTTDLINRMPEMPDVEIISHANARETVLSNYYRKADQSGYFLEDCY